MAEEVLDKFLKETEELVERAEKLKQLIYDKTYKKKQTETYDIVCDIIETEIDKIIERTIQQRNNPLLSYLFSKKEK